MQFGIMEAIKHSRYDNSVRNIVIDDENESKQFLGLV